MKIISKISIVASVIYLGLGFVGSTTALGATTPSLGAAATFGVLATTFTRNVGNTAITGDLGRTGGAAGSGTHTVTGTEYVAVNATYTQAGIDQGAALVNLNSQPCTFTFAPGAINLATDTTHGPIGIYTPGVYCTGAASAASIGTAGITLSGAGTYIFKIDGALTSVDNSKVLLANGASSCNVFWAPTAATTLGANSTFVGTIIDDAGITMGNSSLLTGRALAFAETITTDTATINASCSTSELIPALRSARREGRITVVKTVINDNGRASTTPDFPLFINGEAVVSGETKLYPAPANAYDVTETTNLDLYSRAFSGDCDINGRINLNPGDNKVCVVTNDDIGSPVAVPATPPLIDLIKVPTPLALPAGPGLVTYTYTLRNIGTVPVSNITMVGDTCKPLNLDSGDRNSNSKLDLDEVWTYRCSTTITETHTNTVVATGWANGLSAVDIANATVVVGVPVVPPLIHVAKVPSSPTLPVGGGVVTYINRVTNLGKIPLSNVRLTDDKCSPVNYVYGDINNDLALDITETWLYTCQTNLSRTTVNTVTASGDAGGLTARDFAIATVVVAATPGLPNTGFFSEAISSPLEIGILLGILAMVLYALVRVLRRKSS